MAGRGASPPSTFNTMQLPGTAGGTSSNFATTPDSAGNSITSDIEISAKAKIDWTAGSVAGDTGDQYFLAKFGAGGNRAFAFGNQEGKLKLRLSADGTGVAEAFSTTHGFAASSTNWVRVTWRNSDDRVQFFTSVDGTSWTQLGSDGTLARTGIRDSSSAVTVGGSDGQAFGQLVGNIYYAELRNGIGGTVVHTFDATAVTRVGVRNPSSVSAGGPWTITGSGWDWVTI